MKLIDKLNHQRSSLSKSEQKVARIVLNDLESVIRFSIAKLAATAKVSEPTVNRFCRSLGCKGFADFKLQLAQELAAGEQSGTYNSRNLGIDDPLHEVTEKIFESTMAAIASAWGNLDHGQLDKAIDIISRARKLEFFTTGYFSPIAEIAQRQFRYFDFITGIASDADILHAASHNLASGDVVLILPETGDEPALLRAADKASSLGATVIAVANNQSHIAGHCDILLASDSSPFNDLLSSVAPGIIAQIWINALVKGILLKKGPGYLRYLETLYPRP
jgi:RpiR family carbohydrate utilization transcriptional regulator